MSWGALVEEMQLHASILRIAMYIGEICELEPWLEFETRFCKAVAKKTSRAHEHSIVLVGLIQVSY